VRKGPEGQAVDADVDGDDGVVGDVDGGHGGAGVALVHDVDLDVEALVGVAQREGGLPSEGLVDGDVVDAQRVAAARLARHEEGGVGVQVGGVARHRGDGEAVHRLDVDREGDLGDEVVDAGQRVAGVEGGGGAGDARREGDALDHEEARAEG